MQSKLCVTCTNIKPYSEFHNSVKAKDGKVHKCKSCCTKYKQEYYKKNKTSIDIKKKKYALTNRETIIDRRKLKYLRNKANENAYAKRYYETNKASILEKAKIYKSTHMRQYRVYSKTYKHKRRELEKVSELSSKALASWTSSQIKFCSYCGTNCKSSFHIDHVEPLSKGGSHSLNNLAISCPSCNM